MRTPQGLAIYAATSGGFSRGCGVPSGGLLRSFDDGVSWTRAESLGVIGSLAVEPTEHRYSYMSVFSCQLFPPPTSCAATLIYASEDGGDTWTFQSHQPLGLSMFVVSVDPNDPRIVYAWSYDGLMRSSDSGRTWSETAEINGPTTVLVSPSNPSNVFAATNSGAFYRSGDRGLTWQRTAADPPAPILALAEDPRDPEVLMAGTDGAGVVRSKDAGETWAPDNRGIENLTVYALLFEAEGRILHAATESGVFSRETPAPRVISHR
jgi:photosystem II stability/assembly factor-like uncharacterized protein